MIFDIVNGSNSGRSKAISCTDLVNLYYEVENGEESKVPKALINCPGYRNAVTAYTEGYCRALYPTSTGRLFAIISNKFIEISSAEVATVRGTLLTSTGMCAVCDNGSQVLIVDGTYGYIYTLATDTLVRITSGGFPSNTTHCLFTDGYFIVNSSLTGQFYFSSSYDGTTWSALDFATAEYSADVLIGLIKTSNGTIWMIGKQSLELWQGTGISDLPWNRIPGAQKEIGCIAPYSIASNGTQVFWVGSGQNGYGAVFMGSGYEAVRISTPAVEYQVKQFTGLESATGFVYSDEGHSFYVVNFTSEDTFVYDISTGKWHRRGSLNTSTGLNVRQFAQCCAFFNEKYYVGSYKSGNIYEMSLDVYKEDADTIKREIVTNHIFSENKQIRHNYFEIDVDKGEGLTDGADPIAMLRFSDNGGKTWSNFAMRSMGKVGQYSKSVSFSRLGTSRDRVYHVVISCPSKVIVTGAFIEAS